jgi:hypothetical protein
MEAMLLAFCEGVMVLNGNEIERHDTRITLDYDDILGQFEAMDENTLASFFKTVGTVFARRIPDAKFAPEDTVKKWVAERGNTYLASDLVKYRIGARAGRISKALDYVTKAARLMLARRKDVQERLKLEAGNGGITLKELYDTPTFERWVEEKAGKNPEVQKLATELEAQDKTKATAQDADL